MGLFTSEEKKKQIEVAKMKQRMDAISNYKTANGLNDLSDPQIQAIADHLAALMVDTQRTGVAPFRNDATIADCTFEIYFLLIQMMKQNNMILRELSEIHKELKRR